MRVGLSMLNLVPGRIGGSERYATELTKSLVESDVDVFALVPGSAQAQLAGLPTVAAAVPAGGSGLSKLSRVAFALVRPGPLRRQLDGADVVHYPLTVPLPSVRSPWVTTLHDLQHLDLPRLFSRVKRAYRAVAYDRAARQADAVIVVSEFVRGRAVELLGLDPGRVHAIAHGVDHGLFRPGGDDREPFLLYPAHPWPHKNHARLLQAFALVRAQRPELRLVLAGADTLDLSADGVDVRGRVTDEELASLYQRAACLVFPSLYEGFGLPALEAMACGCPVAASARGALPEVCDGAAVLFDPEEPGAIAAGVLDALSRADDLRRRGLTHAAEYTWTRTAQEHARVYRLLLP